MRNNQRQSDHPDLQQLLELRFTPAYFRLLESAAHPTDQPGDLTEVMQLFTDQLSSLGFNYSHEIMIEQCIGKTKPSRMLAFVNANQSAYAILTDLYHQKSWVYFTHYCTTGRGNCKRVVTTCQPGALKMDSMRALSATADFVVQETGASNLGSQWKKHQQFVSSRYPTEQVMLMDPHQHLDAEREAYKKYTDLLLDCVILRQSDTQLTGFTHTGASGYLKAVTSTSVKRPNPKVEKLVAGSNKIAKPAIFNYRNAALAASTVVAGVLVYSVATYQSDTNASIQSPMAVLPQDTAVIDLTPPVDAEPVATVEIPDTTSPVSDDVVANETKTAQNEEPIEQFIVASEEDEMWRIAVENAEFYLMSNDGDPAPWIRTARKMAAGFTDDDPRLARTYFLAAMLEPEPEVAEQQYNRALSIQTKSLGLYHTETAQTLEALAWVAEGARDDLDEAITHQRLALNIYRSIFGEEAEDTRAARWKLQYFEDRLDGRRPKSDDNRRLLPALARFAR